MITVRRAYLVLGSICMALVVFLGYACLYPIDLVETPALHLASTTNRTAGPPRFEMPPTASFAELDARPIFDPSRRPVASPPDAPPLASGASLSLPSLTLVGIIIDDKTRLAMIKATESSPVTAYSVGTWLGEWQIVQIEADKIVLHANNLGNHELRLTGRNQPSAPAAKTAGDGL